jgi:hypothetical protein
MNSSTRDLAFSTVKIRLTVNQYEPRYTLTSLGFMRILPSLPYRLSLYPLKPAKALSIPLSAFLTKRRFLSTSLVLGWYRIFYK